MGRSIGAFEGIIKGDTRSVMAFFYEIPATGKSPMTNLRNSNHQQRMALKSAFRRGLESAGGGASFCNVTRVNAPTLYKYAAAHDTEHFPPIDVCLDIDLDIGKPVVLAVLASAQGYGLVRTAGQVDNPTIHDIGSIAVAVSKVQSELAEALADGAVCADEAKAMTPAVEQAMHVLRQVQAGLVKVAEECSLA